jgi:hypothetical protein
MKPTKLTASQQKMKAVLKPIVEGILKEMMSSESSLLLKTLSDFTKKTGVVILNAEAHSGSSLRYCNYSLKRVDDYAQINADFEFDE